MKPTALYIKEMDYLGLVAMVGDLLHPDVFADQSVSQMSCSRQDIDNLQYSHFHQCWLVSAVFGAVSAMSLVHQSEVCGVRIAGLQTLVLVVWSAWSLLWCEISQVSAWV